MARLSFIEQERIARNMTDDDILGEYEQKGSVLPPGVELDPSVLLGEMNGRTYVRDATEAAQTAADMPPGSTADQQVEKFKQGRQGVQDLLAQGGPQGEGMPPQEGMPPEAAMQAMGGMPPEGVQMAASGGVIGLQTGSPPVMPQYDPSNPYAYITADPSRAGSQMATAGMSRDEMLRYLQAGRKEEKSGIPYLSGATEMLFGARTLKEARENPMRVLGTTGMNVGLGALTALTGGMAAPLWGGARMATMRGLPTLIRGLRAPTGALQTSLAPGGQKLLEMSSRGGLRSLLSNALGGGKYRELLRRNPSLLNRSGDNILRTATESVASRHFMTPATQAALDRARKVALAKIGGVGVGAGTLTASAIASALQSDDTLNQEQIDEAMAAWEAAQQSGGDGGPGGPGGDGFGGAYASDIAKVSAGRMSRLSGYEQWLRKRTPEEEALDNMLEARKTDILGRIDPERDRGDLLTELIGGSARAIDRGSRGGSAAETLADTASAITSMGGRQRQRNEMLDDTAFALGIMPKEGAAKRTRQSVAPLEDAALADLQQQLASLEGIDINAQAQLLSQLYAQQAAERRANEFGVGDMADIENLIARTEFEGATPEEIAEVWQNYQSMMQNRLGGEAAGRQMGGTNNPLGQYSWTENRKPVGGPPVQIPFADNYIGRAYRAQNSQE